MLIHLYRVKHKPTGLYYAPGRYSNLQTKGKVYSGGNNIINFIRSQAGVMKIWVRNAKTIASNKEYFYGCGTMHNSCEWFGYVRPEDFEIETITFIVK